ncbi:hypothetical protein LOZ61_000650 [Ophidiomyces ophidiicola]|nr:hypothetical protein LOZ61_000650 [Ophidiomyces ophidiicola]KAI1929747.1 hypothetical protein LOZ60_001494 [Ophidiomyces ophidiicola]KAI1960501.1 hypothetical protein LOZ59_002750 [Ophidiomyces ophidiicola]KAI1966136.1 hypothetical protein LOZ56_005909 [Ophidiomyces ophidiicola]KAI2010287.1 hypothetical protein LOZ50_001126 [Ophidiomyces ophidiicola]
MEQPTNKPMGHLGAPGTAPKRKFAPQLVESSSRSYKKMDSSNRAAEASDSRQVQGGRVKFQQHETTKEQVGEMTVQFQNDAESRLAYRIPETTSKKFLPQLIETAKRSFRQDNTYNSYGFPQSRNIIRTSSLNPRLRHETESRFSYANLVCRRETRRHSFRVPDLPAIPSSSSEESLHSPISSLATSPNLSTPRNVPPREADPHVYDNTPDSFIDVNFYSLPDNTQEKLLQDQALAAFPNEQVHQQVSHFAIDPEDEDDTADDDSSVEIAFRRMSFDQTRFRRQSSVDLTWELEEMRRHKEESVMRAREQRFALGQSNFSAAAIASKRAIDDSKILSRLKIDVTAGFQKGTEAATKDRAVRPPMLGNDIVFPQCESPQTSRCESDQHSSSHYSEDSEQQEPHLSPLWAPKMNLNACQEPGLWHSTCKKPSGLFLPSPKITIFETRPDNSSNETPAACTVTSTTCLAVPTAKPRYCEAKKSKESIRSLEEMIEHEFNDEFITQIYNYLSLGYPCLARDYDEEISSVTNIPVEELRKDDQFANAKGHLNAPESVSGNLDKCARWVALRLYIHEWARKQPTLRNPDSGVEGWGVRARGSWAV